MTEFADDDLTRDSFLNGRLHLLQPRDGYRAGIDPVLLAAAIPAKAGETVLELGCGAGTALLCLAARVPGLSLTGIEIQSAYAELARRNAEALGQSVAIYTADLTSPPDPVRQQQYRHVFANPPYFEADARTGARDPGRETALAESQPLVAWVEQAARRLAPKGYLHMIQRVERLPEIMAACLGKLGSIEVLPVAARQSRAPDLILLRARKGGRAAFRLLPSFVLHIGDRHLHDGDSFRPEVQAILRDGNALDWPTRS